MASATSALWITTSLFGILIGLLFYAWKRFRTNHLWKVLNVPCEDPLPFLGNTVTVLCGKKRTFDVEQEWYQKHKRIFGAYLFKTPALYVGEPELLRDILVKDSHIITDRVHVEQNMEMMKEFLSVLTGDKWKRVRSVISPAFSTGRIKKMMKLMEDCGETTVQLFLKAAETGEPADIKRLFGGYSLDVIASTAFGTILNSAENPDNIFVQHAKTLFTVEFTLKQLLFIVFPKLSIFLKGSKIVEIEESMHFFKDLTLSIIERRKKTDEPARNDFLSAMLEAQNRTGEDIIQPEKEIKTEGLTPETAEVEEVESFFKNYAKNKTISSSELIAQCVLFFSAGFEATSATLSLAVYYLATNPSYQQKVVEEVDAVLKKYGSIDSRAVNEMKYTDAVISETLRLAPPNPKFDRTTSEEYTVGNTGITIPKGTMICVPIYSMHHDPEFFPDPETFNPDRFLPENKDMIRPYSYLPFGAGTRNCLGMRFALTEIKMGLLVVFRSMTFEVCEETKIPAEIGNRTGLLQPVDIKLRVIKRNN